VLSGDRTAGRLRRWLSRLAPERGAEAARLAPAAPPAGADWPVLGSKTLARFLAHLGSRPSPVLLDLGPFSGANVTYYGQRLGCKVLIADLITDLDRQAREGRPVDAATLLSNRFALDDGSIDGVLLWDVCDYLDGGAVQALARTLVKALRAGGVVLGLFGSTPRAGIGGTKFVVEDDSHVRLLPYATVLERRGLLPNRAIIRVFDGLRVTESYLLQNGWREMLFCK